MRSHTAPVWIVGLALLSLSVARPSLASSVVTIDFEAQTNLELVTDQFVADHVLFGNVIVLESFSTLNELDFPPTSGIHAVTGVGPGPAVIEFLRPARMFSVQLTTADTALVEMFGPGNVLLDTALVAANLGSPTEVVFQPGGQDIAMIRIAGQSSGNAFLLTLDDVVFAIPEPSAFLVMAAGLVPIASAIRRRPRA